MQYLLNIPMLYDIILYCFLLNIYIYIILSLVSMDKFSLTKIYVTETLAMSLLSHIAKITYIT